MKGCHSEMTVAFICVSDGIIMLVFAERRFRGTFSKLDCFCYETHDCKSLRFTVTFRDHSIGDCIIYKTSGSDVWSAFLISFPRCTIIALKIVRHG